MFIPRPYQNDADHSLESYIETNPGHPTLNLPTGTGKSVIPPMFIKRQCQKYAGLRFGVLTHVKELVGQNVKACRLVYPTAPIGVCSAGLNLWQPNTPLVYGSIQTCYKRAAEIGRLDMLFVDEAQLVNWVEEEDGSVKKDARGEDSGGMYQQFISDQLAINPHLRVCGLSATPYRMGHGMLTDPGGLFTGTAYDMTRMEDFLWFIEQRYLSDLITPTPSNIIDVSDARQLAADFNQRDIQQIVDRESITRACLTEAMDVARDRRSWIVFASGVQNAHNINDMLNAMGCPSTVVHSNSKKFPMKDEERDRRVEQFKQGRYRAIVNYGILTTGFDHPAIDCIIDLRPTTSSVLHVQKYGRGTRPYFHPRWSFDQLRDINIRWQAMQESGKTNCLILDFAGNIARLGPINAPKIPKKKGKGTGEVPVKTCEDEKMVLGKGCGAYNYTVAKHCNRCGAEFMYRPKVKPNIETADAVARSDSDVRVLDVDQIYPSIHKAKKKGPDGETRHLIKLQYITPGLENVTAWLAFEYSGFAKKKARDWWRQHCGDEAIPETNHEFMQRFKECRIARKIRVNFPLDSKKYPDIIGYIF